MKRIVFFVLSLCLCMTVFAQTAEEFYKTAREYANKSDYEKMVEYYRKAAEEGHAEAALRLGVMYWHGFRVDVNYKESVYWWEKAADHGDDLAPYFLGQMYEFGNEVKQDSKMAKAWYGRACENGNPDGCDAYQFMNRVRRD